MGSEFSSAKYSRRGKTWGHHCPPTHYMGENEIHLALQEINMGLAVFACLCRVETPAGNLVEVWVHGLFGLLLQAQPKINKLLWRKKKLTREWEESLKHSFEAHSKEIALKIRNSPSTTGGTGDGHYKTWVGGWDLKLGVGRQNRVLQQFPNSELRHPGEPRKPARGAVECLWKTRCPVYNA